MSTINENTTINGTLTVSNEVTAKKDLHVRGWLYAANVANIYKGSFANTTDLNDRWPAASCEDGWVAGVGNQTDGLIAYVFNATAGEWQSTGAKLYVDTNTDIAELQTGKVDKVGSATAGKIALLKSDGGITQQNSKSLSELAEANHSHGNIRNEGQLDSQNAIASGDKLVVTDQDKNIVGRDVIFDGETTNYVLTKKGVFRKFPTEEEFSYCALKSEMSIGALSNGKRNIQLKSDTSVDVVVDDSGKENSSNKVTSFSAPTNTQYPSALLVYNNTIERLGAAVCETLQCTFAVALAGDYHFTDFYKGLISELSLVVINGVGYDPNGNVTLSSGSVKMGFVFKDTYSIPDIAFDNMPNLTVVHIPSYVKSIGSKTFKECIGLQKIECECMTPPAIESDTFDGVDVTSKKVFVHRVAGSLYQASNDWNQFVLVDMNGASL